MKRTILLFVTFLATIAVSAQSGMTYSWEFVAGVGVGRGPQVSITPEFVAQYDLGGGFRIGAGAGTRFARPCVQYITRKGSKSRTFCNELDIPMFMRLGYGKEKLYANLDAGYALCALSFFGPGWAGEGKKEPNYNGFFVEPQVGWKVGRRSALALGLLFQQSTVSNHVTTENGTWGDPSYSIGEKVTTLNVFTPAITLRYVVGF
jgi:hypothetical protein